MWKVVPLCEAQRQDVKPKDILAGGLFRVCDTNTAMKGQDLFSDICNRRLGRRLSRQFVVQLYGCVLNCNYCYVTEYGVWGGYVEISSISIIESLVQSRCDVLHLMGGSPALYIENWIELIKEMECVFPQEYVFHSDLLLLEKEYDLSVLKTLAQPNVLLAVNVKGCTPNDFEKETRKQFYYDLFFSNLKKVVDSGVNFYITVTTRNLSLFNNMKENFSVLYGEEIVRDMFSITPIEYKALTFCPRAELQ